MEDRPLIEMNEMLIRTRNSGYYRVGKNWHTTKKLLKKLKLVTLLKKIVNRRKIARLSVPEKENDYKYADMDIKKRPKIVVYTCITGNYDDLAKPLFMPPNIDYVFYTNQEKPELDGWQRGAMPKNLSEHFDNALKNRYVKLHPKELFGDKYDYSVYIDGNVRVVGDLTRLVTAVTDKTGLAMHRHRQRKSIYDEAKVCKILGKGRADRLDKQIEKYEESGFPEEFGLYECNVIVTDLGNKTSERILEDWWEEFLESGSERDQIALPYVVWKNGFKFNDVGSLGNNVYRNPLLMIDENIHRGYKNGD